MSSVDKLVLPVGFLIVHRSANSQVRTTRIEVTLRERRRPGGMMGLQGVVIVTIGLARCDEFFSDFSRFDVLPTYVCELPKSIRGAKVLLTIFQCSTDLPSLSVRFLGSGRCGTLGCHQYWTQHDPCGQLV